MIPFVQKSRITGYFGCFCFCFFFGLGFLVFGVFFGFQESQKNGYFGSVSFFGLWVFGLYDFVFLLWRNSACPKPREILCFFRCIVPVLGKY